MPSIERAERHQRAVLWAFAGHDRHGRLQVSSSIELTVRWETVNRTIQNEDGTPLNIDATVWLDRSVVPEGIMWLGRLADLPSPATDLMQIVTAEEIPDLKGRVVQYSALLRRYGDTLPDVA